MPADVETQLGWLRAAMDEIAPPVEVSEVMERGVTEIRSGLRWPVRAAATLLVTAALGGLVWLAARDGGPPNGVTGTSTGTSTANPPVVTIVPATDLVAPSAPRVSVAMQRLLDLPTCEAATGLAEWAADQFAWFEGVDAAGFVTTSFADATREIPVDTADADDVACTAAISSGDVRVWGLGDGQGGWLSRGAGIMDPPDEFDRPPQPDGRPVVGDVLPGHALGNGQILNDFFIPTDPPRRTVIGAMSFGPIVAIELREPVVRSESVERWYHLRTSEPFPTPEITGDSLSRPSALPIGFGECSDAYIGVEEIAGSSARDLLHILAVDYCDDDSSITVAGTSQASGEPVIIDGQPALVDRRDGRTAVAVPIDDPSTGFTDYLVASTESAEITVEQLAAIVLSIPGVRGG